MRALRLPVPHGPDCPRAARGRPGPADPLRDDRRRRRDDRLLAASRGVRAVRPRGPPRLRAVRRGDRRRAAPAARAADDRARPRRERGWSSSRTTSSTGCATMPSSCGADACTTISRAAAVPARARAADVSMAWRVGPRAAAPYAEEAFNAILQDYAKAAAAGRVVFPVSALRCLDRLAALARRDLLVLAADRGTVDAADAVTRPVNLELARHGSISLPVNFHALRTWVTDRGGQALQPARETSPPSRHGPAPGSAAGWLAGNPRGVRARRSATAARTSSTACGTPSPTRRIGWAPRSSSR